MDSTATPETGPVDAPATMDSVLAEFETGNPRAEAADEVVAELVKDTEDEGQADEAPDAEESATDPTDEDDESDKAPPETEDPVHKVKINGEDHDVPLSELLKGYSRNEDYKSKTMALADERRTLDQARATVETDVRGQYANDLKQSIELFEQLDPVLSEARQIDWAKLKAEDPATFVQYSDAVNQRLQLVQDHRAKLAHVEQQQAQAEHAQILTEREQRLNIAANKIVELMPELKEGDAFQKFAADNISYLRETGFTPEEINEAIDDRAMLMADKARKWDALQRAKLGLPAKKVVLKSSVKPMTTDASDSSRSSTPRLRSGSSRDQRVDFALRELMKD